MMMQKILITLLLIIGCGLVGYSQQAVPVGSGLINKKITDIDAYVREVDNDKELQPFRQHEGEFEYSAYSKTIWSKRSKTQSSVILKVVTLKQNLNTTYYRDGKKVYMTDISAAHGNESKIVSTYFENDMAIYTKASQYEEQVLQVSLRFNGAESGGDFNLVIDRDSISLQHFSNKPTKIANTVANWEKLKSSFTLSDFDKVKTGQFESHLDGTDMAYTITTDKRQHAFVNANNDPVGMKKLAKLVNMIDKTVADF